MIFGQVRIKNNMLYFRYASCKTRNHTDKKTMHYSVGALIRRDNKLLLIDRAIEPFGCACIAGHVDEGEDVVTALQREVFEESGLTVTKHRLIAEEELDWNWCSKGVRSHYWYVFECEVAGTLTQNKRETRSIGWYTEDEIQKLQLEPVWKYWFEKLHILSIHEKR